MELTNQDQFNNYLIESINLDGYEVSAETDKEKVPFVLGCFNKEYNFLNNKKRLPLLRKRLAEWIEGLPGVFEVSYWHEDIETDLKTLGFTTANSTEEEILNAVTGWFEIVAGGLLELAKELNLDTNYLK